jgi:branched-chain amino acid aminotransferase
MAANYFNRHTIIYHNGHFVKAADARIDLYSQTMHYGYGVFEGIRSYRMHNGGTAIFKAKEHFDRLAASARALNLPYTFDTKVLIDATYKVLERNNLKDAYIRPLVYAPANMSFVPNKESYLTIEAWEMAPFLGEKLLRVMISSFERPNPKAFFIEAKARKLKQRDTMRPYCWMEKDKLQKAPGPTFSWRKTMYSTPRLLAASCQALPGQR